MRVVVADPPAFTPPYDHALASALAAAGAEVELATSRFRFGAVPVPDGYRRRELFYPLSSRLFGRSRLRVPLKVLEHPVGLARLAATPADVVHVQWLAVPKLDSWLLRHRAPLVLTAHDLLPRRTAGKTGLWRRAFGRFERIVVHSERGRETLTAFGVADERLRVIPHPVTPSDPTRADDGRTVLALGLVRPYKQLDHAREAVSRVPGAQLRVAGDADAFLSEAEIDRALGESTVAVFPYRPELDQSGALLRALGAGVPAVVYDVGGLAEPVRAFGAGRVVTADDVEGLAAAIHELLDDDAALTEARAGAARARTELTWEASAQAHLALYEELLLIFRRDRFGELIRRQLDLFSEDEAELLREAEEAERAYDTADRALAEEAYGDYQLVLEAIADALADLRDTYAATLDDDTRESYEEAFDRAANRRFRSLTGGL